VFSIGTFRSQSRMKNYFLLIIRPVILGLCCAIFAIGINGCAYFSNSATPSFQKSNLAQLESSERQIRVSGKSRGLTAGIAKNEITPPWGTPLAGFGKRKGKPSIGVLDPLWAHTLVVSDGEDTVAFVSLDLMAVHEKLRDEVLQNISAKAGIGPEDLFLMASHTHSGSGGLTDRWTYELVSGKYNRLIFKKTAAAIAHAINEAFLNQVPVKWGAGKRPISNFNQNRMIENGPVDSQLTVIRIDGPQDKPLALLTNFSAHPTILGSSNFKFSADFPGHLAQTVEKKFPGALCLFSNSASADIKPSTHERPTDYEESVEYGERLGVEVIATAENIKTENVNEIVSVGTALKLPPVKLRWGWLSLPGWLGNRFFSRETYINAARIGNVLFLSVPGEMSTALGLNIKNKMEADGFVPVIAGYTNDYIAYILTRDEYKLDEYEASVSFYGPRLGEFITELLLKEGSMIKRSGKMSIEK